MGPTATLEEAEMARGESWTDERLDDLNEKVDRGFAGVDKRFNRLEDKLDRRFERIDERFERIDERFERLFLVLIAGLIAAFATLLAGQFG